MHTGSPAIRPGLPPCGLKRSPHTPVVVFTDKLGASLTKILGIAAVVPKSDGVAKLGRIEALLDAQDALAMQGH